MSEKIKILISRTDAIGDVVLTLPMCKVIKDLYGKENSTLTFLGKTYTEAIINSCSFIDCFLNYDSLVLLPINEQVEQLKLGNYDVIIHVYPNRKIAILAGKAGIPLRIGTKNRWYHWLYCTKLVSLSRKNSDLHEAQLNLKLLEGMGIYKFLTVKEISKDILLDIIKNFPERLAVLLDSNKFNLILHPKSNGSAREWSLDNYRKLIDLLPEKEFKIFISGIKTDDIEVNSWINNLPTHISDLTGKMNLIEFISFINSADGLIAASTGPLHISASLGKNTLGLYPPIKPIFPKRWAPLGPKADFVVSEKECGKCKKDISKCECMDLISPEVVLEKIKTWKK